MGKSLFEQFAILFAKSDTWRNIISAISGEQVTINTPLCISAAFHQRKRRTIEIPKKLNENYVLRKNVKLTGSDCVPEQKIRLSAINPLRNDRFLTTESRDILCQEVLTRLHEMFQCTELPAGSSSCSQFKMEEADLEFLKRCLLPSEIFNPRLLYDEQQKVNGSTSNFEDKHKFLSKIEKMMSGIALSTKSKADLNRVLNLYLESVEVYIHSEKLKILQPKIIETDFGTLVLEEGPYKDSFTFINTVVPLTFQKMLHPDSGLVLQCWTAIMDPVLKSKIILHFKKLEMFKACETLKGLGAFPKLSDDVTFGGHVPASPSSQSVIKSIQAIASYVKKFYGIPDQKNVLCTTIDERKNHDAHYKSEASKEAIMSLSVFSFSENFVSQSAEEYRRSKFIDLTTDSSEAVYVEARKH